MRKTLAAFVVMLAVATSSHAATISKQFTLLLGPAYTGLAASITYKVIYTDDSGVDTVAVAETTGTGVTEETLTAAGGGIGSYNINVASFDTTKKGRVVWFVGGGYNLPYVENFVAIQSTDNSATIATINTNVGTVNTTTGTINTNVTNIGTALTAVGNNVTSVKAKTDNLPASPAATGDTMAISDKTGFKLASDGLDGINTTLPSTASGWNFRQMLVMVNQWAFGPSDKDVEAGKIRVLANDGSTVITRQTYTADSQGRETKSKAQ